MIKAFLSFVLLCSLQMSLGAEDARQSDSLVQTAGANTLSVNTSATKAQESDASSTEDAVQGKLITDGRDLLEAKRPQEAINNCFNKVLGYFEAKYGDRKERIYCIRTRQETIMYLFTAASEKQNAVVLNYNWARAHFFKAYAFIDMGSMSEAKGSLEKALALSPWNSLFLSEMGHCYQSEKNWDKSLELFKKAEEAAEYYSPDELKSKELTRALRGQGYALVELGKLDEAASKYEQCITLSPEDKTARGELAYIRTLRGK